MRKLLQTTLLGAIAVAISSCSSIKPLDSAGVAKLCTDHGGKLFKTVTKNDGNTTNTKITCKIKKKPGDNKFDARLFEYDKDIEFKDWAGIKVFSSECLRNGKAPKPGEPNRTWYKSFIDDIPREAAVTMPFLTNKQNDEYKEAEYKKCKLDLSYKMYEKEKDAFNNVHAEEK
jgi:hypothetical protein